MNYAGSNKVKGMLINQFAMDEHNGFLRVAYTEDNSREKKTEFLFLIRK